MDRLSLPLAIKSSASAVLIVITPSLSPVSAGTVPCAEALNSNARPPRGEQVRLGRGTGNCGSVKIKRRFATSRLYQVCPVLADVGPLRAVTA
jgi:hypothetical protein